ncbi:zinc-dependent peptidase [Altericista sp. CCNU0014]|uniref:M90 family metallopeptidase n=1 Tax=Altericista sp. CCNU0014 TaxID=3082949 RepID=UPI00384E4D23
MIETAIVLVAIGLIIAAIFSYPAWVRWRRSRLKRRPLSPQQQATVECSLPAYECLTPNERRRLQGHIQVFIAEKQFIGCRGLQVTPEMKVTVAAIAALLLLNERGKYFPRLRSILIYPDAYVVRETVAVGGGVVEERQTARLGESWTTDQVVLSWKQIQDDLAHWNDGKNVVLHEFAHQLDQEDGKAEGVPILHRDADYAIWAEVMAAEYQQLCDRVERGAATILNPYGATDPAEFFAVATETFFEMPQQLLTHHRRLYEQLQHYYRLDPARWS